MKTILLLVCILGGSISSFSQDKVLQKSDFDEIIKTSLDIFKAKPYRTTITSESNLNGASQGKNSSKTVIEVVAAKKIRVVNEKTSNETTTKREYVQIDDKAYSREDNGQWKDTKTFDQNQTGNISKIIEESIEYKLLAGETFNGQSMNVYLKTSKNKKIDTANNNQEILSKETIKY